MKWALCYLIPNDYVTFKTDISDSAESLPYQNFIAFIFPHIKNDHAGFLEFLNKYMTLYIDLEKHHWSVYRKQHRKVEFDELLEFNQTREEKKQNERIQLTTGNIGLYKKTINKIFDRKYGYDERDGNRSNGGTSISAFFNRHRRQSGKK